MTDDKTLRVDLTALDAFVDVLDHNVLARIDNELPAIRAQLQPESTSQEPPFGRSDLDSAAAELGRAQQANIEAHIDRLTQVREELAVLREGIVDARSQYREADEAEAVTARAVTQLLDELRTRSSESGEH